MSTLFDLENLDYRGLLLLSYTPQSIFHNRALQPFDCFVSISGKVLSSEGR